jgi:hypothetical protein
MARPPGVPITLPPGQMQVRPLPTPAPTPRPQPAPPPPPPKSSLLWLWILLGVITAGAAVAATIALTKSRPAEETSSSGGGGGEIDEPHVRTAPAGDVVSIAGYQIVMPLGFIQAAGVSRGIGGDVQTEIYTGSIGGNIATVHAFGNGEDLQHSQQSELDDGCGDIARAYFGGEMVGSRMVSGSGAQLYRCSIAGGGQVAEGAFYSGAAGTLVVFFAADPGAFEALGAAREELFERRVTTTSSSR